MLPDLPAARLLIVEDHPLTRDGIVGLLQRAAPQLRCSVADGAPAALRELAAHGDIDLVLADLRLPGPLDGIALLAEIGRLHPTAARVLVSGSDDPHLAERARRLGLMGFLPKRLEPAQWLAALSHILGGERWFPRSGAATEAPPSERQLDVLQRLAAGQGNKEIARALGITERTVKYHLAQVYGRLGAGNRAEAVALAGRRGWIQLGPG